MSKIKNNIFKYPCVYTTHVHEVKLYYSNIKKQHFGLQKVIWSNGGGSVPILDSEGKYGLTQFAYAITDTYDNLNNIKKAMMTQKFIKLMSFTAGNNHRYDSKTISFFKKDFWKEFV